MHGDFAIQGQLQLDATGAYDVLLCSVCYLKWCSLVRGVTLVSCLGAYDPSIIKLMSVKARALIPHSPGLPAPIAEHKVVERREWDLYVPHSEYLTPLSCTLHEPASWLASPSPMTSLISPLIKRQVPRLAHGFHLRGHIQATWHVCTHTQATSSMCKGPLRLFSLMRTCPIKKFGPTLSVTAAPSPTTALAPNLLTALRGFASACHVGGQLQCSKQGSTHEPGGASA